MSGKREQRRTVELCMPQDLYDLVKQRADSNVQTVSTFIFYVVREHLIRSAPFERLVSSDDPPEKSK